MKMHEASLKAYQRDLQLSIEGMCKKRQQVILSSKSSSSNILALASASACCVVWSASLLMTYIVLCQVQAELSDAHIR